MKYYHIKDKNSIILRDYLARDRTMLACERTLLSYFRTSLGLFSAGVGCIKLISDTPILYYLGYLMIVTSPAVLIYGVIRFVRTSRSIKSIPDNDMLESESEYKKHIEENKNKGNNS